MKTFNRISGEPVKILQNELRIESCCDCGLAHTVFYLIEENHIIKTSFRDEWETRKERDLMEKRKRRRKKYAAREPLKEEGKTVEENIEEERAK